MRNQATTFLFITLVALSCSEAIKENPYPDVDNTVSSTLQNERIRVLNTPIQIVEAESLTGQANFGDSRMGTVESSPTFNCSESIDEAFEGNKKVDNKKVVCLSEGVSFNGTVELKGGTFVIHGDATLTGVNGSKGEIVVTETGSLTMQGYDIKSNFELSNYSNDLDIGDVTVSGDFKNYGVVTLNAITINSKGELENQGNLTVTNNLTSNKKVKNKGTLTVKGDLTVNGGGELDNECKLIVEGNFQNNKTLKNKGYVKVLKTLTVNGGAKVSFEPQSYLVAENLVLNGSLEGSSKDFARVDIGSSSTINGGGKVRKKLDFNDFDGIEVNNGSLENSVTLNESLTITVTDCNPGPFIEPLSPEYTLVADIAVPVVEGSTLSATDVVYDNSYAFISYHLNGSGFGGAIDVLNLTSVNAPAFSMNFDNVPREFNALTVGGSTLYLAGQRDIDDSKFTANNTRGAVLYAIDLDAQKLLSSIDNWTEIPMPSFSGNSVEYLSNREILFASGATNGGFYTVDPISKAIESSQSMDFAKYMASDGNLSAKLVGGPEEARLILSNNSEVALGYAATPVDGKNVVLIDGKKAYITLGQNGLVVVNTETGNVINHYKPEKPGLTNGIAIDDDFVYLANGESGLLLLRKNSLEFYGQYKYSGSANLVEVYDNIILIANGTGGIKLLLRND